MKNKLIQFADDTTVVGLISGNGDSAYRQEVSHLTMWCVKHNLELNSKKDCRAPSPLLAITINSSVVKAMESFKFLGTTIKNLHH